MNIGIDIDGVLTDVEAFEIEKGKSYFKKDIVDETGEDVDTKFGVTKEEKDLFWRDNYREYILNVPLRPKAKEIIRLLHEENNHIYIITARYYKECYGFSSEEDFYDKTREFLDKNGVYYDELVFTRQPKLEAIEDYDIDVMIDDATKNISAISKLTKVIVFDAHYNEDMVGKNIYHAGSWDEVYSTIKGLES